MTQQDGNLTNTERAVSAAIGLTLAAMAGRRGNPLLRIFGALAGGALLARSYAGHCGMKAALVGKDSLQKGMSDQWDRMRPGSSPDEPPVNAQAEWTPTELPPQADRVNP